MDEQLINQKLNQQTKLLKELVEQAEKTRKSLLWMRILSLLKVFLIVAPLVLGIIYLPPFVRKLIDEYKNIIPGLHQIQEIIDERETETLDNTQ